MMTGLLLGQGQDFRVPSSEPQAPTGLFGRLRAWRTQPANVPSNVPFNVPPNVPSNIPYSVPSNGPTQERSLFSRLGDRFGGIFGRGQSNRNNGSNQGVNSAGTVIQGSTQYTTNEPPLLEPQAAPASADPHPLDIPMTKPPTPTNRPPS